MLKIRFTLNGRERTIKVDPDQPLLWLLRVNLGMTGTKYGCGEGHCGACTVLMDDEAVPACQVTCRQIVGRHIVTIEGLAPKDELHPVQKAFMEHDALQCGYCTPGMILQAVALLKRNPDPSEDEVKAALEGNLCRCGAHNRIVRAVLAAAKEMKGGA